MKRANLPKIKNRKIGDEIVNVFVIKLRLGGEEHRESPKFAKEEVCGRGIEILINKKTQEPKREQ